MKNKLKQPLDYIPFILLVIYTVYQWHDHYVSNIVIPYRTYGGVILLLINIIAYLRFHQFAVLLTGLICLLGFSRVIMVSPSLISFDMGVTTTFGSISYVTGSLYFIGIFILHFIVSFRFYIGILTKKYWRDLAEETRKVYDR